MANIELAKKIKAAITAKPELWDQHKWAAVESDNVGSLLDFTEGEGVELTCGTTMCIAGWACHLSGEKIDWRSSEHDGDNQIVASRLKSGEMIEDRAAQLLGVDGSDLFYVYNEETVLDHLDQIIEHGEIIEPYRLEDSY